MAGKEQGKNTFKLIYEFNNDSSLFARLAYSEIENKNYQNALDILEKGMIKFPSYPTANLIYSTALAYQGRIKDAISCLEKTKDFFNCDETFQFYLNKIEQIDKDQNSFNNSTRFSFLPGNFRPNDEVFENNLASIAEELKKAKISFINPIAGDISPREEQAPFKQIVSETMAKIFISQGKNTEAISIYEELLLIEPEKKEYYQAKIAEIKLQQGS